MIRVLVFEDGVERRYEVRNEDGELVGYEVQSKLPPPPASCDSCGRPY